MIPTLSYGHACTQSRQKVQSILPTLRGWYNASSQPRWITTNDAAGSRTPRMQSFVAQRLHTSWSRTVISSGEAVAAAKLNCPIGHTNLQNVACLKIESITSAAAK